MFLSFILISILGIASLSFINNISKNEREYLKDGLLKEATAHFNSMVIARR